MRVVRELPKSRINRCATIIRSRIQTLNSGAIRCWLGRVLNHLMCTDRLVLATRHTQPSVAITFAVLELLVGRCVTSARLCLAHCDHVRFSSGRQASQWRAHQPRRRTDPSITCGLSMVGSGCSGRSSVSSPARVRIRYFFCQLSSVQHLQCYCCNQRLYKPDSLLGTG